MNHYTCVVPVSPLRSEAAHRSELVTQQLFGETCQVIEHGTDHWVKVRCHYDDYEGWCQEGHIAPVHEHAFVAGSVLLTFDWANELSIDGGKMMLPLGSTVVGNAEDFPFSTWDPSESKPSEENIRQVSSRFINTTYLWGGKSVFGIDCSGFSQTIFKFLGIKILRDASQQATHGDEVGSLADAQCGDLAFFDNKEGRITHVGILLGHREIIHSSVKVRIDSIDEKGIIQSETGERTHRLCKIRRYW